VPIRDRVGTIDPQARGFSRANNRLKISKIDPMREQNAIMNIIPGVGIRIVPPITMPVLVRSG